MKAKRILAVFQFFCVLWLAVCFLPPRSLKAASNVGLGEIGYSEIRDIDTGVELEYVMGTNNHGEQKAHTVEIAKGALTPAATYGTYVYGGEKLTSMLAMEEANTGKKVVAAINGDFYDTSNGIPSAIMIVNGRFVTSGTGFNSRPAIGFKADGSVVYGRPKISIKLNDGSKDIAVNYLNNDRKYNETSVYLYTSDFGATTKSIHPGTEARLNIVSGDFRLGEVITAVVESVGAQNTPIGEGQIVIAAAGARASDLSGLTPGKTVAISLIDENPSLGWSEVVQAIGYNEVLAEGGALTPVTESNTDVHPRSAIGIKEDGTVVLFQVDGRQPGWSNGLTYKQIAEHLVYNKGCQTVVNLDGGGSSTLTVRLPGNESAEILNSPSDGFERSNSNALLFFTEKKPDENKIPALLHNYPNNLVILEGAAVRVVTKATDVNYFPVPTPSGLSYEVKGDIGVIDGDGVFTAKKGAGAGEIIVRSGNLSRATQVTVVDEVTNIICDKNYISVSPGERVEIKLSAFKDGMPINASNSSFTWELSSPVLGTIENGVFTGTTGSAAGFIYISYKNFRLEIPVEIGKQPVMISTFEDAVIGSNWLQTIENPGNGGKGDVTVNTDERFVKFGEKSLRVDYDFTKAVGTTSVTAHFSSTYYALDGYPTHIGMWVYGDGGGANIRIMIYDGDNNVQYISFMPDIVTWDGWKYIEAEIPAGLPTPLKIRYPIRVMSVGGSVKTAGTLYFDNIRAVYGFRNDDKLEPRAAEFSPADGATVESSQPTISVKVWDEPDEDGIVTGVNKSSVKMWINESPVTNLILTDNPDGTTSVNYTPSALDALRPGPQVVKVRVEDHYGNVTIKNWQFFVAGDYVGVGAILPANEMIYAGDIFAYAITASAYENFERFEATLYFNHKSLEIINVAKGDPAITLGIVDLTAANAAGELDLLALGMNKLTQPAHKKLIIITFRTREGFRGNTDTAIGFKDVRVKESGYETPRVCLLPPYEVKINYRYILTYVTSTVGRPLALKVTDQDMNPVEGAGFLVEGADITLSGRTGADGVAVFDDFATLPAGASFTVRAVKGAYYSEKIKITMVKSLGDAKPFNVVVTPALDASRGAVISWQTDLDTTATGVLYRKKGEETWRAISDGHTKEIHVVSGADMREYLAHRAELSELEPGTEYEYRVGDLAGDDAALSPILSFKTPPAGDISLLFLGDPQNSTASGYEVTKNLIEAAKFENPAIAALLIAGDIVDDANIYSQWQAFAQVLSPYVSSMVTIAASGNHDVIRNYGDPFAYTFPGPGNAVDVLGVCYYAELGAAAVAVIDTETPAAFSAQAEWLKTVMASSEKKFKLVLMHRSAYAANYDEPHIRDFWPAVFDEAGIDLVLSGHDHIYNSASLFAGERVSVPYGVVYVVGGSAGSKFYNASNLDRRPWIDFLYDEDNPVFTTIDIKGDVLTVNSYALSSGSTVPINRVVIDKGKNLARSIEILNPVAALAPGAEHVFETRLLDKTGAPFSGEVVCRLKEDSAGVVITPEGRIAVDSAFREIKEIEVEFVFESVRATVKLTVYGCLASPPDALDYLARMFNDYIEEIYK